MILIIDGYNLLFHEDWHAAGSTLEEQREHLLNRLSEYHSKIFRKKMMVVFDARSWGGPYDSPVVYKGLRVVYASCAGGADEKIVSLCEKWQKATVITADRKLGMLASRHHATIVSPQDFLKDWQHQEKAQQETKGKEGVFPPRSEREIQYWLDMFGLEENIEIPDVPRDRKSKNKKR